MKFKGNRRLVSPHTPQPRGQASLFSNRSPHNQAPSQIFDFSVNPGGHQNHQHPDFYSDPRYQMPQIVAHQVGSPVRASPQRHNPHGFNQPTELNRGHPHQSPEFDQAAYYSAPVNGQISHINTGHASNSLSDFGYDQYGNLVYSQPMQVIAPGFLANQPPIPQYQEVYQPVQHSQYPYATETQPQYAFNPYNQPLQPQPTQLGFRRVQDMDANQIHPQFSPAPNIYKPEVVYMSPAQTQPGNAIFEFGVNPPQPQQRSYLKPSSRSYTVPNEQFAKQNRSSGFVEQRYQPQDQSRPAWVDLGINHPHPVQHQPESTPEFDNIYANPPSQHEPERIRLQPRSPPNQGAAGQPSESSRQIKPHELIVEPPYFSAANEPVDRQLSGQNTYHFKSGRNSAFQEPAKLSEPTSATISRPASNLRAASSQKFVKVSRYSRNADGGTTLLSEEYEPNPEYAVVVDPSAKGYSSSNQGDSTTHRTRSSFQQDIRPQNPGMATDIYAKPTPNSAQKPQERTNTINILPRVEQGQNNIYKQQNEQYDANLDLYSPNRVSQPRMQPLTTSDLKESIQSSANGQFNRTDIGAGITSTKSINIPTNYQDQYRSFSSHLNGVGNSPTLPPISPVQPQKVVSVPATGLIDSYKEPLVIGTPTSRGRMNSPNLAETRGGLKFDYNDRYQNRAQGPVTVEVDYKNTRLQQSPLTASQRYNEGSLSGTSIDQLMFQSMKSKPAGFLGERPPGEPVQERATPTNQRPFFSSAPRTSPASTGDQFSLTELKSKLEQSQTSQKVDKVDPTRDQANGLPGYDKPLYQQKDTTKPASPEQPTQRLAPMRPFASFDSKAPPTTQPLSPWTPTATQPSPGPIRSATQGRAPPQPDQTEPAPINQSQTSATVSNRPSPPVVSNHEPFPQTAKQTPAPALRPQTPQPQGQATQPPTQQTSNPSVAPTNPPTAQLPPRANGQPIGNPSTQQPTETPKPRGPLAERAQMVPEPAKTVTKSAADLEIEHALKFGQKKTRQSATVDIKDVKEPFLEEISSKVATVQGPYAEKRTRTSARDSHDAKVKLIKDRRQADNPTNGVPQYPQIVDQPVKPASPPVAKPTPEPEPSRVVEIIYKEMNGKRYPVKIDSSILSEFEKQCLLKQLHEKEGYSQYEIQALMTENDNLSSPTKEGSSAGLKSPKPTSIAGPIIPVETISEKAASPESKRGSLEFSVTPEAIIPDKKVTPLVTSNLVMNIQNEIIDEQDEEANSKSSRRESVGVDNIEALQEDTNWDAPPSAVKKQKANFKKPAPVAFNLAEIPPFKAKVPEPVEDLEALLKRNEELMKLLGDEFGDLDNMESPKPLKIVKESRGLRNNLSEKYNSGQFSHLSRQQPDEGFVPTLSEVPTLENESITMSASALSRTKPPN